MSTAIANFTMVEGNLPARRVKNQPTSGARMTIVAGLMVWYVSGLMTQPNRGKRPSVLDLAKVAILPAACSEIMKNRTPPIHRGM